MRNWMSTACLVGVLIGCTGCGDDVKPPPLEAGANNGAVNNGAVNNGGVNNGGTNNGGTHNGGTNNGRIPIDRDAPAQVHVVLDPVRLVYAPGLNVLPSATVYSGRGQVLEDREITWTFTPADAAELLDNGRFRLQQEGEFSVQACVPGQAEPVCGRAALIVDAGPPMIEILSPAPGAQLDGEIGDVILVEGRVWDTHGAVRAFMGGEPVETAEDGTFAHEFVPRFGVNHIEVVASDGIHAGESLAAVDVLWARRYHPVDLGDSMRASFDDGMFIRLGQDFFDDREALEIVDPARVETADLAGIVELLIGQVDFLGFLPNPIAEGRTLSLRMTDFEVREPSVLVDISDEGVDLYIRLDGVRVTTEGQFTFQNQQLDLNGGINATISAYASARFEKEGLGRPYRVEAGDFEIALEEASSHFASGEANAVFEVADSALRVLVEEALVDGLGTGFLDAIPQILVDALQDLERAIDGQSIRFSSGFGAPLRAELAAEMGRVDPVNGTHILGVMKTEISSDQSSIYPDSRGVASAVEEGVEPTFFSASRFQTGVRMTMINGMLHTLWQGGVLNLNVVEALPPEFAFVTSQAQTEARLPPILGPPLRHDAPWDLELQLGQFEFEAELNDRTDLYAFNIVVGVYVLTDQGGIRIDVEEQPVITAWSVRSTHPEGTLFDAEGLTFFMLSEIWPDIAEQLRSALRVQLPSTELREVGEIAPTLSDFQLDFVLEEEAFLSSGYLVFDGNLVGVADITQ